MSSPEDFRARAREFEAKPVEWLAWELMRMERALRWEQARRASAESVARGALYMLDLAQAERLRA